jgi:hypothetical protein
MAVRFVKFLHKLYSLYSGIMQHRETWAKCRPGLYNLYKTRDTLKNTKLATGWSEAFVTNDVDTIKPLAMNFNRLN